MREHASSGPPEHKGQETQVIDSRHDDIVKANADTFGGTLVVVKGFNSGFTDTASLSKSRKRRAPPQMHQNAHTPVALKKAKSTHSKEGKAKKNSKAGPELDSETDFKELMPSAHQLPAGAVIGRVQEHQEAA